MIGSTRSSILVSGSENNGKKICQKRQGCFHSGKMSCSVPQRMTAIPAFLELLEPRVAPAVLVVGAPVNEAGAATGAESYTSPNTPFQSAQGSFPGLAFTADHYFLDLSRGDSVNVFAVDALTPDFIKLGQGSAFAFFFDRDRDGVPTVSELTGLSLSSGARIDVKGDIDGDVVANRNGLVGSLVVNSLISGKQTIAGLTANAVGTDGGANGKIIAGGSLSNIRVDAVNVIQSGTPVYDQPDRLQYNFGGTGAGPGVGIGTLQPFDPGARVAGGSLTNITVTSAEYILAGDGGSGGRGGNISNVLVVADVNGLLIKAGDGGAAARGGAGGSVSQVVFQGAAGSVDNAPLRVLSGDGGDGGATGRGGAAGKLSGVWIGYEYAGSSGKVLVESADPVRNNILVGGGDGGTGATAGAGGSVSQVRVFSATPDLAAVGYEIQIAGGPGGLLPEAGARKAGAGGSVTDFKILNFSTGDFTSDARIAGGDASSTLSGAIAAGQGANGGSVSNPVAKTGEQWLVGASFRIEGGDGSDSAARGGAGGSVSGLAFQSYSALYLRALEVEAGAGGLALTGRGGAGGSVSRLDVPLSDLNGKVLSIVSGAGGASLGSGGRGGTGGTGGSISRVDILDFDSRIVPLPLEAFVRAGDGAAGFRGGGAGGNISDFSLFSTAGSLNLASGEGGDTLPESTKGKGGSGGNITGLAFVTTAGGLAQNTLVKAGDGGDARGNATAGNGGGMVRVNIQSAGAVDLAAGDGGQGNRAGAGGSLGGSAASAGLAAASRQDSVTVVAGQGGVGSSRGTGGSVTNVLLTASTEIQARAGDGGLSAAGGNLSRVGFYGSQGASSSPSGNVVLRAGDGGDSPTPTGRAGNGGSVQQVSGFTSNAPDNLGADPSKWNYLKVEAGSGGGSGVRGGAGGSVNGLSLFDGFAPFLVFAGQGGDGSSRGGAGGSILNVSSAVQGLALVLAAGDGGDALSGRAGAVGGSVDRVNVLGDIGIRNGVAYGFEDGSDPAKFGTRMGGIFAGKGGDGAGGAMASAGKVTNITAQAISAIVAGREASPYLVSLVDRIYLSGNESPREVAGAIPNLTGSLLAVQGQGASGQPNVLGAGSSLVVAGSYNGELSFQIRTTPGADFDGTVVVYIDADGAVSGVSSTESLFPSSFADPLGSAVAGFVFDLTSGDGFRSVLDFDLGFRPEYALAISNGQAELYGLSGFRAAPLISNLPVLAAGDSYGVSLSFADFELSSSLQTSGFSFVGTYLAGPTQIPVPPAQLPGAYRTDQSVGFGIVGGDPGSSKVFPFSPDNDPPPVTRVPSYEAFTHQMANFVGAKASDPSSAGFAFLGGNYAPSATEPLPWIYGAGGTQPLDGLIAAANLTSQRNFMPLAFLTGASGNTAQLFLPTLPSV